MDLEALSAFLKHSPTVRLLCAESAAYVLHFLRHAFKSGGAESVTSLEHEELKHRLERFQEQLHEEGHNALTTSPDRYLREWSDAGWLRRFLPADSSASHYQLTRFAEDGKCDCRSSR